jgi:radical SAM superfamily enzyme YgiQ (UPF0313 family)
MINKIILFGEFTSKNFDDFGSDFQFAYCKNFDITRLGNALYKEGFEVKQVHHCTSFNRRELEHILETFSQNEKVLIYISSGFLTTVNRQECNRKDPAVVGAELVDKPRYEIGEFWGERSFEFLKDIGILAIKHKFPVVMGGTEVIPHTFTDWAEARARGYEVLDMFVNYFIVGKGHDSIVKFARGEKLNHFELEYTSGKKAKLVNNGPIRDWDDYAFTPTPDLQLSEGEAVFSQVAGGCIFSCSFCVFDYLGKKPNEYLRSYESLKNEIVYNWERSRTRTYLFTDHMINDNLTKLKYLARIRDETGIDVRWGSYARLDTIKKKENIQLFKDAGAAGVIFGIESLKKDVGAYIGKNTDGDKIKESLHIFRDGIGDSCIISGSFICGAPTETKDELRETFNWLNTEEGLHLFDHHIWTPLFIQYGINDKNDINRKRPNPWKDYTFPNKQLEINGIGWTSPWGTYEEFQRLSIEFNQYNDLQIEMNEDQAKTAKRGVFGMPVVSNVLENGVEEYVRALRAREPLHYNRREAFKSKTKTLIENYRKSVLGNYYGEFA